MKKLIVIALLATLLTSCVHHPSQYVGLWVRRNSVDIMIRDGGFGYIGATPIQWEEVNDTCIVYAGGQSIRLHMKGDTLIIFTLKYLRK